MNYNINDRLNPRANFLYGLQWWIVTVPSIIAMGLVLGKTHFGADMAAQSFYMQKLFFMSGITLLAQILWGHRLPLVIGPASVLLVGILASLSASIASIYTAVAIGGLFLLLLAVFGLLKYLQRIFSSRVIIVIMLLIPLTLGPTIINLVFVNGDPFLFNLLFVIVMSFFLLVGNRFLPGIWNSMVLVIGIAVSTLIYYCIHGFSGFEMSAITGIIPNGLSIFIRPEFDPGVILAFIFCAVALIINEVSSIEAVGQMLSADQMEKRTQRGVAFVGVSNILSGMLGTVGGIDYSGSAGIIASTRCASRYPFIPAAFLLIICAFIPQLIQALLLIPNVVMGAILLYVMISMFAAGFQMLIRTKAVVDFSHGASIGFSLMVSLLISFLPAGLSEQVPALFRPILCNGFVMGVITVLLMENIVYRKNVQQNNAE